jgi:hypothetical protein
MDPRLIPLNGLIALVRGDGLWPCALGEQGLRIHLFEAPAFSARGNVTIDALLYRNDPPLVLLCECKGGRNVKTEQASRYLAVQSPGIFAAGSLPPSLRGGTQIEVATVFVGNEASRGDLETSLGHCEIEAPLLTVGPGRARLTDLPAALALNEFDIDHRASLPPARFPIDQHSPAEEVRELVVPIVVAAQARQQEAIDAEAVCRELLPEWPVIGNEARRAFCSRVEDVMRRLAEGELGDQLAYEPGTKASGSRIRIVETPASADPRGTSQSWQARQRRAARALGRLRQPIEGQLVFALDEEALEDLAQEGGVGDPEELDDQ